MYVLWNEPPQNQVGISDSEGTTWTMAAQPANEKKKQLKIPKAIIIRMKHSHDSVLESTHYTNTITIPRVPTKSIVHENPPSAY